MQEVAGDARGLEVSPFEVDYGDEIVADIFLSRNLLGVYLVVWQVGRHVEHDLAFPQTGVDGVLPIRIRFHVQVASIVRPSLKLHLLAEEIQERFEAFATSSWKKGYQSARRS